MNSLMIVHTITVPGRSRVDAEGDGEAPAREGEAPAEPRLCRNTGSPGGSPSRKRHLVILSEPLPCPHGDVRFVKVSSRGAQRRGISGSSPASVPLRGDFRMSKALRVLITGAARGIGMATAQVLANRGHWVVATDLSAPDISTLGGLEGIQAHRLDVTSDDSVAQCLKEVGPLDAIVNNAAIFLGGGPVEGYP